ncbi:MAG: hypothetical protein J6386_15995 [Candidatus Synoicihabitans palmerolidicus]|nr:hypothetical protein [Candidatus Synoicihabitans palmerolidicus]
MPLTPRFDHRLLTNHAPSRSPQLPPRNGPPHLCSFNQASATSADRVAAASLLAFGLPHDSPVSDSSIPTLLSQYRTLIAEDTALQSVVALRASADAFGGPTPAGLSVALGVTYAERLRHHIRSLGYFPDAYRTVIERAYRRVINRDAYEEEIGLLARPPGYPVLHPPRGLHRRLGSSQPTPVSW